jgi:PAS domain S-box-containing protein
MKNQLENCFDMNEKQMKCLLESTNAIPWVIDWATKEFSYIGPQIEKLLGYPRDSWVDASVWSERIHPEDRERVVNYCISQSEDGEDHYADYRALTKDGSVVWIRDIVHVVREQGVTKEITGFMFNITESKLVEEELAFSKKSLELSNFILEKLAAGEALNNILDILTLGAEKNIEGAFASILLLDDSGTRLFDGSTPSYSQEIRDAYNGLAIGPLAASCGTAAYTKQIVCVEDISTDPRWAKYKDFASSHGLKSCHSAPILGSNGTVFGTFALAFKEFKSLTDIEFEILQTSAHIAALAIEQKRSEENLQIYAQELEDFIAIASHDFQAPLKMIKDFSDRLKSEIPESDDRPQNYLDQIQSAASKMNNLVVDLQVFSKLESKDNFFKTIDLKEVIERVLEELADRIVFTKGQVNVKNLPALEADPVQMQQLFSNIIDNALKFHREEEAPVVNLAASFDENGNYVISIEDNGIGIDKRNADRIFKPFKRAHERSKYEGSGIGLAICKKIVSRHGGNITFENKPTHGVTFHITLPVKQNHHSV